MTTEEKRQLQGLAARYEIHGVSFIELLRMVSSAPPGTSFRKAFNCTRLELSLKYGTEEMFSVAEAVEMNDFCLEVIKKYIPLISD